MKSDRLNPMSRFIVALIASMTVVAVSAASADPVRPKLVVGIVIDGLDDQYLDLLRNHFGQGGFNRLMRDGVVLANVDYGTNVDATAATAMLMTGTSPSVNSITGRMHYDRETMRSLPSLYDSQSDGMYTETKLSPRNLVVGTLADEVRIAGGGLTRVYAVAPDGEQAVILGGHSGNGALWIDENTGNWATSTYYKDTPAFIVTNNRVAPLRLRLDTVQWTPLKGPEAYASLPPHATKYPFRYIFSRGAQNRYDKFLASGLVNSEITDIAGRIIDEVKLGESGGTDMLNVAFNLKPYDFTISDDNRYELIDSYLRLDKNLEQLFNKVDNAVGRESAVFFVAATPPTGRTRRDDPQWGIPYGEFSTKKAKSLLNMYLIAVYGNGEWVSSYNDGQFFLNHKLISQHNLQPAEVRERAARFLAKMSGVDRVYTIDEILAARGDERLEALRRNAHPDNTGDVWVEVDPGWEVVDDITSAAPDNRVHYVKRVAAATAPVIIMAPAVDARVIDTPIDVRVVAPTVARLLRIRSPNGAGLPSMVL